VLHRWVGKIIVREARGREIESRRARQGHLIPVLPSGTKTSGLLSRKPSPGSKTGTKGPIVVVELAPPSHVYSPGISCKATSG